MKEAFTSFKLQYLLFLVSIMSFTAQAPVSAQFFLDLETGLAGTGYNDVRIPGNGGTFFSLKDDLDAKPGWFYRVRAGYTIKERHTLSLLYAPLTLKSEGSSGFDILFEGVTFAAGMDLSGTYKFNSYRLTYRYDLVRREKLAFGLGLTAKIRDAKIALESGSLSAEKSNIGFVPIINFRLDWQAGERLGILLDGDALAAPQGRAEDVLLAVTYRLSDNIRLKAGYRILEGGADNDEVYNFALVNYAAVGVIVSR
ncbi:MAG TPA: hypothetical protein VK155_09970 [Bacteroidales bacterium]|jgi:hypothetical protein|nr:hypothetical protein [Bacteroidales bacterium]